MLLWLKPHQCHDNVDITNQTQHIYVVFGQCFRPNKQHIIECPVRISQLVENRGVRVADTHQ